MPVFNLEIEGTPEFYANGLLVHNCPICDPLNGQFFRINEGPRPPADTHPRCRCARLPAAAPEDR